MVMGCALQIAAQVRTTDSLFICNSRPIHFIVDKIDINEGDRRWITDTLIPTLQSLGDRGIVLGRAAASPEGSTPNNRRLAQGRRASLDALLSSFGISPDRIRYDVITEDYAMLRSLMQLRHDARVSVLDSIMQRYEGRDDLLKKAMKRYDGGRLWKSLLREYFPQLRAVRIMAIDEALAILEEPAFFLPGTGSVGTALGLDTLPPLRSLVPTASGTGIPSAAPIPLAPLAFFPLPTVAVPQVSGPRREVLSVKTNLLFDFAYMPGYDRFCPIPNVAVEFYPLHGHFTYGLSFDGPWWQHYDAHKYFQVRNYQAHVRYYLRSGDIRLRQPGQGAAFRGFYVSAYAHAGLYNICFGERRGWEGEGWGAGLGLGYVVPLGRREHWRLEFGLQAGYFRTLYDPYQWLCPVSPETDPERYYYKWYGEAKDFRKRQHRYSWLGPTRLEVTLSYDLLYRCGRHKGVSFRREEPHP